MNKLLLLTIALAITCLGILPTQAFAKKADSDQKKLQVKHAYSKEVSRVEKKVEIKKIPPNLTSKVGCQKNCVNGAKKTIAKNYHAKCGKALGKKTKFTKVEHQCSGCKPVAKERHINCAPRGQKVYGYGYGHSKNDHKYSGYGRGHKKHNCGGYGKGGGVTESVAEAIVPTASAHGAGSYDVPEQLPNAGAGILIQLFTALSILFGVMGVRRFI